MKKRAKGINYTLGITVQIFLILLIHNRENWKQLVG